jgi:hypothetical protein
MSDSFTTGDRDVIVAAILAGSLSGQVGDEAALVERYAKVLRALREAGGTSKILQSTKPAPAPT